MYEYMYTDRGRCLANRAFIASRIECAIDASVSTPIDYKCMYGSTRCSNTWRRSGGEENQPNVPVQDGVAVAVGDMVLQIRANTAITMPDRLLILMLP